MVFAVLRSMVTGSCGIHTKNKSPECHPAWLWDAGRPADAVLPQELICQPPLCCHCAVLPCCTCAGITEPLVAPLMCKQMELLFTPSSITQPSSGYSDLWREVAAGKEKLRMGGCCSQPACVLLAVCISLSS